MFFWVFFKEKKTKMILYYYKKKTPKGTKSVESVITFIVIIKKRMKSLLCKLIPINWLMKVQQLNCISTLLMDCTEGKKKWKWLLKQTEMSRCSCWKPLCMSLKYSQLTEHSNLTFCRLLPTLTSTGQMFKCRHALRSWWNLVLNLFCYQGISVITSVLVYFFKISVIINNK